MELLEAKKQAVLALEAGRKLAARAVEKRRGLPVSESKPTGGELGALLGQPSAFWAWASSKGVQGDADFVEALHLATKVAAARVAVGDMGHVRESLLGQAQWLSLVAVDLLGKAEGQKPEQAAQLVKLALAAQKQAAQCLASAAALEKLKECGEVTVG